MMYAYTILIYIMFIQLCMNLSMGLLEGEEEEALHMKRRREPEMVAPEIQSALEELPLLLGCAQAATVNDHLTVVAKVPIKPFLSICSLLIQVLDKIGPTMAVLRKDIHQNIERLENWHESYHGEGDVVEILKKEVSEGKAKAGHTCSKAFVWLTRSLDFTVCLLQLLVKDFQLNIQQAVEESYSITIKPWHGWISSAAYKIALKLVPDSQTLVDVLRGKDEEQDMLREKIRDLIVLLSMVVERNKDIMRTYGLDKLKSI